jgi:hypothetical protein
MIDSRVSADLVSSWLRTHYPELHQSEYQALEILLRAHQHILLDNDRPMIERIPACELLFSKAMSFFESA